MLTGKQRAHLRGMAAGIEPIVQIGKNGLTPEVTDSLNEAIEKRELVKVGILQSCNDDPRDIAERLQSRTHSDVVAIVGRKIVFYRRSKKKPVIELPVL